MKNYKLAKYIMFFPILFLIGCNSVDLYNLDLIIILTLIPGVIGLIISIVIYSLVKRTMSYQLKICFGILLIILSVITFTIPYRFSGITEHMIKDRSTAIQYFLGYIYVSTTGYLIIIILCSLFFISGVVSIVNALKSESVIEAPDFLKDLWGFLKVRKKFWLLPIILTLLFFGALLIFAANTAIAPFIYTMF